MTDPTKTENDDDAVKKEAELDEKALDGVSGGAPGRDRLHQSAGSLPRIADINASELQIPNMPTKKF